MNAVLVSLLDDALSKGLLTIVQRDASVFVLRTHVLGMSFTIATVRINL